MWSDKKNPRRGFSTMKILYSPFTLANGERRIRTCNTLFNIVILSSSGKILGIIQEA